MTDPRIEIRDDPEEKAYVVEVDGRRAGKAEYRSRDDLKVFVHTEVDDEFASMGLGTQLVRYALDDVRANGGRMVPLCPFFAAYIKRHPEYEDIVDREMTQRFTTKRKQRS